MKVISVTQPWAQLVVDRRRHVIIKTWEANPGEQFAVHASHVRNDELARVWYSGELEKEVPKNALLGVVEVIRCVERGSIRKSKFDASNEIVARKKEYAIVVRTVEKFRKPLLGVIRPLFVGTKAWECNILSR